MEITYTNTFEDLVDVYIMKYINNIENKRNINKRRFGLSLSVIIITLGLFLISYQVKQSLSYVIIGAGLIVAVVSAIIYPDTFESDLRAVITEQLKGSNYAGFIKPTKLTLGDGSIREERNGGIRIVPWKHVRKVTFLDKKIYLKYSNNEGIIVPEDIFVNQDQKDFFIEFIYSHATLISE